MIFHENHLPADDIPMKYHALLKAAKFELSSAANFRWPFVGSK